MRSSKIVCTLGPATSTRECIGELIDAGMDVARLNFSHGEHDAHLRTFRAVRAEAEKRGRAVAILQDLQGPKIRVGSFEYGQVELQTGNEFRITTDTNVTGNAHRVSTTYAHLPNDVRPGDRMLLDDGYLALKVTAIEGNEIVAQVVHGGILKNNKGINLPGVAITASSLTAKDKHDLAFGVRIGVEYIAISFVRSPDDVRLARQLATADGIRIPIIAKIELPQAVEQLTEIIEASDGVMIARGDLGVELGPEKVPLIQKRVIESANQRGKLCITATQMLESMISNARPTRAEASDVANAVLDGTDALMLSGETAVGRFPTTTVRIMDRIISEIEHSAYYRHTLELPNLDVPLSTNAIAHAATIAAKQMSIKTIVVVTESGGVARFMSEYRPEARILALTTNDVTYRRLAPYWGVTPVLVSPAVTVDEMIERIEAVLLERKLAEVGELTLITMGVPVGSGESTNLLKIHQIKS